MTTMFLLVFVVFGLLAYFSLPLNLMPDVKVPVVSVQTVYAGAGTKEIETQITKRVEDAIATVSKIDYVQSYSMEGMSYVIIRFKMGKDVDIANQEVKDKVDAILSEFPKDADKPSIKKFEVGAEPIMNLVFSGNLSAQELYEYADKKLKDRFSQIEGVAQVNLSGGQEREINVRLDGRTVYENNLSLAALAQILAAQNMDMPGGNFHRDGQEYSVRLKGEFNSVDAINEMQIPTGGGIKKIRQLANVQDTGSEVRQRTTYWGQGSKTIQGNVVSLSIVKSSDGNTVQIAKDVQKMLPELQKELPAGSKLEIVVDNSIFVESSVSDTLGNIYMGIFLTGLILFLFLHDIRSTLIVAISMPMSIISTFVLLQMQGFSLNIMSLMGLSTSTGVLTTNSVIVIENIFRHKDMGNDRKEASLKGAAETTVAVLASTLTNVVVFLPIASMSSIAGQFFKEFALTVTYATIFSLVISFTLTPMLSSLILPKEIKVGRFGKAFDSIINRWTALYRNFLDRALQSKKTKRSVITISLLLFVASLIVGALFVGKEFIPTLDEGNISVQIETPQGMSLDNTSNLVDQIVLRIAKHREVKHIVTDVGKQDDLNVGTNLAVANVKLVESKDRKITTTAFSDLLIKELADIPNAKIKVAVQSSAGGGGGGGDPIELYLTGQDLDKMEEIKNTVIPEMRKIDGIINLDTSSREGKPEITLTPKRDKLAEIGTTVTDLAYALRASIEGLTPTVYRESGNEYDIRITLRDEDVDQPEKIANLPVSIGGKNFVMSQLADISYSNGVNKILHRDKTKTIMISAGLANGVPMSAVTSEIKRIIDKTKLPSGYRFKWGGDSQMMEETMTDFMRALFLAIMLTYMLLAATLESFKQPFIILFTLPLALIGVFFIIFATGQTINIFSFMAIIMLVGIVVNNAILMLEYANQLRDSGWKIREAIVESCTVKLKPIIMSTLSTVIGMIPMALGIGSAGREFRQSMGIVSIGGLIASTILALVVIPVMYEISMKDKKSI